MFRLSQKTDYGLILLSQIAPTFAKASAGEPFEFISVSKIATKYRISPKFLSQIAQELKKAGILQSKEGASGGYTLAKEPGQIKLLDVLKVLDGDLVAGKCFEDDHECVCGAGQMWEEMKDQLEEQLSQKTVADLVQQ